MVALSSAWSSTRLAPSIRPAPTTIGVMDVVALTFASGWASGINAYATVFLLGLLGRVFSVEGIPEGFQRTDILILMGVLAALELVADKISYLDSAWDAISTFIRPVAGALIGALLAGANGDLLPMALGALGGVTALASHAAKTGLRLAVNTSPEPVSNVATSLGEDVLFAGGMWALVHQPLLFLAALLPFAHLLWGAIANTLAGIIQKKMVMESLLLKRKKNFQRRKKNINLCASRYKRNLSSLPLVCQCLCILPTIASGLLKMLLHN